MRNRIETFPRRARWAALAAVGPFALAACQSGSSGEAASSAPRQTADQPATDAAPSSALPQTGECSAVPVKVYPGLHFKASNADDIQKQLDTLKKAHDPSASVGVGDFVQASAIVTDSISDPRYARAFDYADDHVNDPSLSAGSLLNMGFSQPGPDCLTSEQVQETANLYHTLVDGLAPKAGRQLSAAAHAAYDQLRDGWEHFQAKYEQDLNQ